MLRVRIHAPIYSLLFVVLHWYCYGHWASWLNLYQDLLSSWLACHLHCKHQDPQLGLFQVSVFMCGRIPGGDTECKEKHDSFKGILHTWIWVVFFLKKNIWEVFGKCCRITTWATTTACMWSSWYLCMKGGRGGSGAWRRIDVLSL